MKQIYHSVITSHDEVMFRSPRDVGIFINLLALHAFRDNVDILADAEMSTHAHLGLFAEKPAEFMWKLRVSYDKIFNALYYRQGRLGEKGAYITPLIGRNHICTGLSYVGRNGLHHGQASTAFGYPHCSANALFAKERGILLPKGLISLRSDIQSIIPRRYDFPDTYVMNSDGVFERTSFMSLQMVEAYYGSARNYLYQMNRLSGDDWVTEQEKDGNGLAPIRITDIEPLDTLESMLRNESGRDYRPDRPTDMDICHIIDNEYVPRFNASSVYHLTESQKQYTFKELKYERHLPEKQIRRCLIL